MPTKITPTHDTQYDADSNATIAAANLNWLQDPATYGAYYIYQDPNNPALGVKGFNINAFLTAKGLSISGYIGSLGNPNGSANQCIYLDNYDATGAQFIPTAGSPSGLGKIYMTNGITDTLDVSGQNLSYVTIDGLKCSNNFALSTATTFQCTFKNVTANFISFNGATFGTTSFENIIFPKVLVGTTFDQGCTYTNISFAGVNFANGAMSQMVLCGSGKGISFENATGTLRFDNPNFPPAIGQNSANFLYSSFKGANLVIEGSLANADFTGSDFSGAIINGSKDIVAALTALGYNNAKYPIVATVTQEKTPAVIKSSSALFAPLRDTSKDSKEQTKNAEKDKGDGKDNSPKDNDENRNNDNGFGNN